MIDGGRWERFPTDLKPLAPGVGPFPHRQFLEVAWQHHHGRSDELIVEASSSGAAALTVSEGVARFAGPQGLTDYHSPLGDDGPGATAAVLSTLSDTPFTLDSLPHEAASPIKTALAKAGIEATVNEHDITAVLDLPDTYEGWLASIGKKERHEVRRKRRKFEATFGEISIERHTGDALEAFCNMHRLSAGDKGGFMTGDMEEYFSDLVSDAGAAIHLLICDGIPRAAAFGFETDDGYFYYNSAYDPDAALASPGVVLFTAMIETEIERGASVFDFLKGDERYKFRHGAEPRQLYTVEGRTP